MSIDERFEAVEREFLKFERIPEAERRHPRPDLCAMIYLHERIGGEHDMVCAAEHDEIFLDCSTEQAEKLTDADVLYLNRCGVRLGEYGLAMFV